MFDPVKVYPKGGFGLAQDSKAPQSAAPEVFSEPALQQIALKKKQSLVLNFVRSFFAAKLRKSQSSKR
jgi:hypothetical protein